MPPRWVQSKLIKMKTAKRKAALIRPRSGGVDTAKLGAYEIFQNSNRVSSVVGKKGGNLPNLKNTWMNEIPETRSLTINSIWSTKMPLWMKKAITQCIKDGMRTKKEITDHIVYKYNLDFDIWAPKALTNEQMREYRGVEVEKQEKTYLFNALCRSWQGIRNQGVSTFHKVDMGGCTMYFSGNEFIFVTENNTTRWVSCTYNSREKAIEAYNTQINWVETLEKNTD